MRNYLTSCSNICGNKFRILLFAAATVNSFVPHLQIYARKAAVINVKIQTMIVIHLSRFRISVPALTQNQNMRAVFSESDDL